MHGGSFAVKKSRFCALMTSNWKWSTVRYAAGRKYNKRWDISKNSLRNSISLYEAVILVTSKIATFTVCSVAALSSWDFEKCKRTFSQGTVESFLPPALYEWEMQAHCIRSVSIRSSKNVSRPSSMLLKHANQTSFSFNVTNFRLHFSPRKIQLKIKAGTGHKLNSKKLRPPLFSRKN